jgi:hypothetical protein
MVAFAAEIAWQASRVAARESETQAAHNTTKRENAPRVQSHSRQKMLQCVASQQGRSQRERDASGPQHNQTRERTQGSVTFTAEDVAMCGKPAGSQPERARRKRPKANQSNDKITHPGFFWHSPISAHHLHFSFLSSHPLSMSFPSRMNGSRTLVSTFGSLATAYSITESSPPYHDEKASVGVSLIGTIAPSSLPPAAA